MQILGGGGEDVYYGIDNFYPFIPDETSIMHNFSWPGN